MTVIKTGADQIVSYDDFYPFGQTIEGRSFNAGLSDVRFKLRPQYFFCMIKAEIPACPIEGVSGGGQAAAVWRDDARIGRWMSADPLAEKYPTLSPYGYAANNPIGHYDFNGMDFFEARSARANPSYTRGKDVFRLTALGSAVWNRIEGDHNILVILNVDNWKDSEIAGITQWQMGWQNAEISLEDETVRPSGRIVVTVTLNQKFLDDDLEGTLFDELFGHIYYERYKLETDLMYQGQERSASQDHEVLGKPSGQPAWPGYPYDIFEEQAKKAKERKNTQHKSSEGKMRPAKATDSARNPRFTDPITGEEYIVD